jgi:hypothetical protein
METNGRVKKNRVVRSEADWKAILDRYDQSGQARVAFCRREGLSSSTFLLWERKLRQRGRGAAAEFIDVTSSQRPVGHWLVEFQFPDGTTARVRG